MPSRVNLMNRALRIFAGARIIAATDGTKEAMHCEAAFDDVRDMVLAAYPFGFATKWTSLAKAEAAPAFGFAGAYALPADFLYLVDVRSSGQLASPSAQFAVVGNQVFTDASPALVRYVYKHNDTGLWPEHFCEAFCMRLAAEVSAYLTGNAGMGVQLRGYYDDLIGKCARKENLQENLPEQNMSCDFITARR